MGFCVIALYESSQISLLTQYGYNSFLLVYELHLSYKIYIYVKNEKIWIFVSKQTHIYSLKCINNVGTKHDTCIHTTMTVFVKTFQKHP